MFTDKHGEREKRSHIVIALEDILGLTRLDRYTGGDFRLERIYFESPIEPGTYYYFTVPETGENSFDLVKFDPDDPDQALDLIAVLIDAFDGAAEKWIPKDGSHPNVPARQRFEEAVQFVLEKGPVKWTNRV